MRASGSVLQSLMDLVGRIRAPVPPPAPSGVDNVPLTPLQPRVWMIVYNPILDPTSGRKLIEALGWNDPDRLATDFSADIQECSKGLVNYRIVQRVVVDEIPVKADGFRYSLQQYLAAVQGRGASHNPDVVDYGAIVSKFNLLTRAARNEFDEVWMFGGPYMGFFESTMAGAGAFFCNAPPVAGTEASPRRFIIMGFSYERGVGEMLEDMGHRAESMLRMAYRNHWGTANLFNRYAQYDLIAPGQANVGLLHFAPNSLRDYDWGNPRAVPSCCDDWLAFPNLPEPPNYRRVTANDWGNGDIRLHHKWWLRHLPCAAGATDGIANFWWRYVLDPNDPAFNGAR